MNFNNNTLKSHLYRPTPDRRRTQFTCFAKKKTFICIVVLQHLLKQHSFNLFFLYHKIDWDACSKDENEEVLAD